MKKFLKKNMSTVIIGGLVVLFIVMSILLRNVNFENNESALDEWLADTSSSQKVVTVLAQTTCSHCVAFHPVMNEVQSEYGFKLYWEELDLLSTADYKKILNTYSINDFQGTPYTFVTENGVLLGSQSGEMPKENLVTFLTSTGVIANQSVSE